MIRTALVFVCLTAACGGSGGADAGAGGGAASTGGGTSGTGGGSSAGGASFIDDGAAVASGTRLRTRHLVADGGARSFLSFYDSQRQEPCSPQQVSATQWRCLPANSFTTTFSDATCSTPMALAESFAPCERPAYLQVPSVEPVVMCPSAVAPRVFSVASASMSVTSIYERADGGCVLLRQPPVGVGAFLGTMEVPLTSFVALHEELADGGPLVAHFLVSDDKARKVERLTLQDSGVEATITPDGGFFVPATNIYVPDTGKDYADSACATEVGYSFVTCSPPTPFVTVFEEVTQCGVRMSIRARGNELTDGGFMKTGTRCMADTTPNKRRFALGPAIPFSAFPPARVLSIGTGVLRVRAPGDDQGKAVSGQTSWFDTAAGVTCSPERMSDGKVHCVDVRNGMSGFALFSDAACTNPIFDAPPPACGTRAVPFDVFLPATAATGNLDRCGTATLRRAVRPFTAAMAWTKDPMTQLCTQVPSNASANAFETELVLPSAREPMTVVND